MGQHHSQVSDEQLRQQLLEGYAQQIEMYPDSAPVMTFKNELYRRGLTRTDIVTIALAALLRRRRAR